MNPKQRMVVSFALVLALIATSVGATMRRDDRKVTLTLREGTSMAAALAPDGRTLAIDLLGRIWTMPATGGAAKVLTDELSDARMPVWSPDGKLIAFQSYRDATWDIWTMAPDGSVLKNLTPGPFDDREPHFSPDGTRLVFSSDRSGNYDIWELELKTGQMKQVTKDQANDYMPAYSPDSQEIAFISDRRSAPGVYVISGSGSGAGTERLVAKATGTVSAPSWTPDGKQIAYNLVSADNSDLVIGEKPVTAGENVFPFRVQWTQAGEALYTADGKIKKRKLGADTSQTIEFSAAISFTRPGYAQKRRDFDSTAPRPAHGIVSPMISPDGKQVAFAALGDIWVMTIGSKPQRLTNDKFLDTDPVWSPDGTQLVFTSDRDGTMDLWLRDLKTGQERRLTDMGAKDGFVERSPDGATWMPDGSRIAFSTFGEIRTVDIKSGEMKSLRRSNGSGRLTRSADGRTFATTRLWLYSSRFREGLNHILVLPLDGGQDRAFPVTPHRSLDSQADCGPVWSPDGTKMAFVMDGLLSLLPVSPTGEPTGAPKKLTNELASMPSWTGDSKQILFIATDRLKTVEVETGRLRDVPLDLTWQVKTPSDRVVIHAGKLFDGRQGTARSDVDIVIEKNRIKSVEPHRAELHTGKMVDASNQTVMPGLIEMHAHLRDAWGEALGRILLSYGVTSVRNPGTAPYQGLEFREAIDSGARVGPRVFTSGNLWEGTRTHYGHGLSIGSAEHLERELERARRLDYDLIKTYVRMPDNLQKRVIEFAHKHGIAVTSHEFYPGIVFGADGTEHISGTSRRGYSPKITQNNSTYNDIISLLAKTGTTMTPTINMLGTQIMVDRDPSYLDDPRFRTLFPAPTRNARSETFRLGPPWGASTMAAQEAQLKRVSETTAAIARAGGKIVAGTDAAIRPYGWSLHMELELYQWGGLTPFQSLQTATINAAEALGMGADLGTIEAGRLADLLIVEGDPLADVRNARKVRAVIKNGEVFDLESLMKRSGNSALAR